MSKTALIIPCYNEAMRLRADAFETFLYDRSDTDLFFVNDGSTDQTKPILEQLQSKFPSQVSITDLGTNQGKAVAVRAGLQKAAAARLYSHIGYLDADLSTSLEEFRRLYDVLIANNADYIYGSRVKMLHTDIQRSAYRHLTGRLIATIVDLRMRLGIYDTQCGAKWFSTYMVHGFCQQSFKTKWLFDIEIFLRIRKMFPLSVGIEKPLTKWKDSDHSKIGILDFAVVCKDIATLFKHYKRS